MEDLDLLLERLAKIGIFTTREVAAVLLKMSEQTVPLDVPGMDCSPGSQIQRWAHLTPDSCDPGTGWAGGWHWRLWAGGRLPCMPVKRPSNRCAKGRA